MITYDHIEYSPTCGDLPEQLSTETVEAKRHQSESGRPSPTGSSVHAKKTEARFVWGRYDVCWWTKTCPMGIEVSDCRMDFKAPAKIWQEVPSAANLLEWMAEERICLAKKNG